MVEQLKKSAKQIAADELAEERQRKAVKLLKSKMSELRDAEDVVKNITRELAELEAEIEAGVGV